MTVSTDNPYEPLASEIVAKRKSTWDANKINVAWQIRTLVPDHFDLGAGVLERHGEVAVAVGAGEDEDSGFHRALLVLKVGDDGHARRGGRIEGGKLCAGIAQANTARDHSSMPDAGLRTLASIHCGLATHSPRGRGTIR